MVYGGVVKLHQHNPCARNNRCSKVSPMYILWPSDTIKIKFILGSPLEMTLKWPLQIKMADFFQAWTVETSFESTHIIFLSLQAERLDVFVGLVMLDIPAKFHVADRKCLPTSPIFSLPYAVSTKPPNCSLLSICQILFCGSTHARRYVMLQSETG